MISDIGDARFYIVDDASPSAATAPMEFAEAIDKAERLLAGGAKIHVLYTEEASQTEITRFARHGIPTSLVSGA